MCENLVPFGQLNQPRPEQLAPELLGKCSIVAGLLFVRPSDVCGELLCRTATIDHEGDTSAVHVATNKLHHSYPVLRTALTRLIACGLATERRLGQHACLTANKFHGFVVVLTTKGDDWVLNEWYPNSVSEFDRQIAARRALEAVPRGGVP
jgi:hypothetical protein